jgi:hypothetical protein
MAELIIARIGAGNNVLVEGIADIPIAFDLSQVDGH